MFVVAEGGHTIHKRWMRHEMARPARAPHRWGGQQASERLLGEARAQGVGYGRMHEFGDVAAEAGNLADQRR